MPPVRSDPYPAFNFLVEISGIAKGSFTEVWGLDSPAMLSAPLVRSPCSIEQRNPVLVCKFKRGWPCKYERPHLNAKTSEICSHRTDMNLRQ